MKRYRFIEFPPKESPNGEWVRWEDVEYLKKREKMLDFLFNDSMELLLDACLMSHDIQDFWHNVESTYNDLVNEND